MLFDVVAGRGAHVHVQHADGDSVVLIAEVYTDYGTFGKQVDVAVDRIKTLAGTNPYLAFSGGKDSVVLKALADLAGVDYDAHYHVCGGVDMPEAIAYTHKHHPRVVFDKPERNMRQVCMPHWSPPTHVARFCCQAFKEVHGDGRIILQGVRWAESEKRKDRRLVERCMNGRDAVFVNPIIDWSDKDVWRFIHENNLPFCSVYLEGWDRVGCVMCPQKDGKQMRRDARRWPRIAKYWMSIFEDLWHARVAAGKSVKQASPQEWFEYWCRDRHGKTDDTGVLDATT